MDTMMFKLILCFLFVRSCFTFMMPTCQYIYPDAENPVPNNMCKYQNYTISDGAKLWSPFPDCNRCLCRDGLLKCCLYGIKSGPIAVPMWCEIVSVKGSCEYEVVLKSDRSTPCYPAGQSRIDVSQYRGYK